MKFCKIEKIKIRSDRKENFGINYRVFSETKDNTVSNNILTRWYTKCNFHTKPRYFVKIQSQRVSKIKILAQFFNFEYSLHLNHYT